MPAGTYTMTNLKSATGIADDRLSAHHPNGTGNTTSFGDFSADDIGWDKDTDPSIDDTKLPCSEVDGSDSDASGSYNSSNYWVFSNSSIQLDPVNTDRFKCRIDIETAGDFVAEQIMTRSTHWTFTGTNCEVDSVVRIDDSTLELECSVVGYGGVGEIGATFAGPMNNAMPNHNVQLTFRTEEIRSADPVICGPQKSIFFEDEGDSSSGHQYYVNFNRSTSDVLFDPNGQVATPVEWDIFKNGTDRGTQSGDPEFLYSITETEQSGGDDWKLVARDANGNFVDAVVWTWGDSNAPYDTGGDPASTGDFTTRTQEAPASSASSPVTVNIGTYTADNTNANL